MDTKKKETLKAVISLAVLIILSYLIIKVSSIQIGSQTYRKNCPYGTEGNLNADLVIKYIDSPYCIWCWLEKPILKKAVAEKGEMFMLEKYDIRYCDEIVNKYGFSGTPSFVFSLNDGSKEFTHYGFLSEEQFNKVICDLSKGC